MAQVRPDMKKRGVCSIFSPLAFSLCVALTFSPSASSGPVSSPMATRKFSTHPYMSGSMGAGMLYPTMYPSALSMGGLSSFGGSGRLSPMSFGSTSGLYGMAASGGIPSYMMPSSATAFSSGFVPGFRSFGSGFPLSGLGSSIAGSGSMYMGGFGYPMIGASMG